MKDRETINSNQRVIIKDTITGMIFDCFIMIRFELENLYLRSNKDIMSKEIMIDELCSNTTGIVKKITYVHQPKIWSSGEESTYVITR